MSPRWLVLALVLALAGCPAGGGQHRVIGPGSGGGSGSGAGAGGGEGSVGGGEGDGETYDDDDDAPPPPDAPDLETAEETAAKGDAGDKKSKRKSSPSSGKRRGESADRRRLQVAEIERAAAVDRSDKAREELAAPHLQRARAALRSGELDRAISAARQALAYDGANVTAVEVLATSYFRKGWLAKAERVLATATRAAPGADAPRLWMLRGLVADGQHRSLNDVRAAYLRATELAPRYAKAWNNLGVVYLRLQKYPQAIGAFENALANDKDSTRVLTNVGTAYRRHAGDARREGQRDELLRKAERAYRAAIALDEDYAPAYLNLGVLYLDAPSFPKMSDEQRLTTALSYLREFKQRGSQARAEDGTPIGVDAYLEAARKQLEAIGQLKRFEEKRKRDAAGGGR